MLKKIFICLTILLTFTVPVLSSQTPIFERIQVEDGYSTGTVYCILQDHYGFLWIGTSTGLKKYDGYTLLTYRHDPNDPESISGNTIRSIVEDGSHNLWIGTLGSGLIRYNLQSRQYQLFRYNKKDPQGLQGNRITSLLHDSKGRLWIGTDGTGLHLWNREKQNFINYGMSPSDSGLNSSYIWSLLEDNFGTLWIGTWGYGLSRLAPQNNQKHKSFERISPDQNISIDYVLGILPDNEGRIWMRPLMVLSDMIPGQNNLTIMINKMG